MNVDLAQELLDELGTSLEALQSQHAALFQFLKDKGIITDDQIAPYLEQAGKASNVRWRAVHVRLESLFRAERQKEEEHKENESHAASADHALPSQNQEPETKNEEASAEAAPQNQEAGTTGATNNGAVKNGAPNGAVESTGKQAVPDKGDAQDEHATGTNKQPSPDGK